TLRDTLARELGALSDLPRDPARAAQAALDSVAAALPGLPPRGAAPDPTEAGEPSRLMGLLSGLVTVRRIGDDDGAVLDPVLRAANLAALELDLATARAAAERADAQAYTAALMRAERHVGALFDPSSARVADVRQQLAAAAAIELSPELPALGATLRELRALRGTRRPAPAVAEPSPRDGTGGCCWCWRWPPAARCCTSAWRRTRACCSWPGAAGWSRPPRWSRWWRWSWRCCCWACCCGCCGCRSGCCGVAASGRRAGAWRRDCWRCTRAAGCGRKSSWWRPRASAHCGCRRCSAPPRPPRRAAMPPVPRRC